MGTINRSDNPNLRGLVSRAVEDQQVLAVLIFGSVARGEEGASSDLDVCLVLQPGDGDRNSQKRLDYLSEYDFDIHLFKQLPLPIRSRVLREGQVLHCKDEDLLYDVAFQTAREYEDFKYIYREYQDALLNG